MRAADEALGASLNTPPFSNADHGYGWMADNCDRCIHDKPTRDGHDEDGCPLIVVALLNRTPTEWIGQDDGDYHCIEFRDENTEPDDPDPQPIPDPPGMDAFLPREDYQGPLMFTANTNPASEEVPA